VHLEPLTHLLRKELPVPCSPYLSAVNLIRARGSPGVRFVVHELLDPLPTNRSVRDSDGRVHTTLHEALREVPSVSGVPSVCMAYGVWRVVYGVRCIVVCRVW
jgi:hypothetical protein